MVKNCAIYFNHRAHRERREKEKIKRLKTLRNTHLLPEERVRTALIEHIIAVGYPRGLITIEKELSLLPDLKCNKGPIPKRRIDILVFSKQMKPLLMIECKAVPLQQKHVQQLIGYNSFVGAPFIALANHEQVLSASIEDLFFKEGIAHFKSYLF